MEIEHAEQDNVDTEPQGAGGDSSAKVAGEQTPAKKPEKEKEAAFSECELPPSIVLKLLKSALPVGTKVSKEAVGAFSKAAGIFVMYLSNCANDYAHEGKRLTVGASDVISAMEELEFGAFVESMKASVDAQNESKRVRKEKQKEKKKESEVAKGNGGEEIVGGDTAMDVEVDGAAKAVPEVTVEGGEVDMKGDDLGETKEETKVEAGAHESEGEGEGEGEEEEEAEEADSDNDDEEGEEEEDDDDKPTGLDDD